MGTEETLDKSGNIEACTCGVEFRCLQLDSQSHLESDQPLVYLSGLVLGPGSSSLISTSFLPCCSETRALAQLVSRPVRLSPILLGGALVVPRAAVGHLADAIIVADQIFAACKLHIPSAAKGLPVPCTCFLV